MKRRIPYLWLIIAFAALIRIIFNIWVAPHYFGRQNIYVDGDTDAWASAITNLIEHGSYTSNPEHPYGYFGRMPGYAFFLGLFYLLSGKDWSLAYPMAGWFQTFIDVFAVYLIYLIGKRLFKSNRESLILAGLYACYPFIIVWNPVCYAESLSIFLMMASLFYFLSEKPWPGLLMSGLVCGAGSLVRPQLVFLLAVYLLIILIYNWKAPADFIRKSLMIGLGFTLIFATWPIRNYVNHQKVIITQDLRGFNNWGEDVISFMQYMFSVQSGWNLQFKQIMSGDRVEWPAASYLSPGDSLQLLRVERLAKYNSSAFSAWKTYNRPYIVAGSPEDSTVVLKEILDDLRIEQIKDNPVNFWLMVPLGNLKKAVFKTSLENNESSIRKLASSLFYIRSAMIILGLIALLVFLRRPNPQISPIFLLVFLFTLIVYGAICFGTSPQFRNIEMRYLLPADIMLLIPLAWLIARFRAPSAI